MKKLMIAASAALCATVGFSDVTSANVVGYQNQDSVKGPESTSAKTYYKAPGMGVSFFAIGGVTTFDLRDIKVEGMMPDTMSIRILSPADSGTTARYTYVAREYLEPLAFMLPPDWETYVGWWDYSKMTQAAMTMVMSGDKSAMLTEAVIFPVGTAFLGVFDGDTNVKFLSSGEVVDATTKFVFGTAKAPYFKNYLPVDTKLSDVVPVVLNDKGEIDATKTMMPDTESIRVISGDDTGTIARYTYVAREYLEPLAFMLPPDWETYVGWWDYSKMTQAAMTMVMSGDKSAMLTNADEISFPTVIGVFSGSNNMAFQFPSAFDLPSAK